jgi:hypothetical protein
LIKIRSMLILAALEYLWTERQSLNAQNLKANCHASVHQKGRDICRGQIQTGRVYDLDLLYIIHSFLCARCSRRKYLEPSTGTSFNIWIVALGLSAEIPVILILGLDMYGGLLLDKRMCFRIVRIVIRIVGIVVRIVWRTPPPRPPSPSGPNPDTAMPAAPAMPAASTMPATSTNCKPRYGACEEEHQNNKNKASGIFHFDLLLC